jgi:hypothetical protein
MIKLLKLLALFSLISASAAVAQSVPEMLGAGFQHLYPNQQFGVMALNMYSPGDTANLRPWPPAANGPLPVNQADNYMSFQGVAGVHSEAQFVNQLNQLVAQYPARHNNQNVTKISVYSYLQPCSDCAKLLANIPNNIQREIGFSLPWSKEGDGDAYDAMNLLQSTGWSIYISTEDQMSFQRKIYMCMLSKPIVCRFCGDRARNIQSLINSAMDQVRSRNQISWANYMNQNVFFKPGPDDAQLKPAVFGCIAEGGTRPIGPRLK